MSSACSCSNRLLTVARMPLSGSPHPGSFGRGPGQERASEKACVRDLIHNAIERNLQTNDKPMMAVTQSKDPLNILHFATALKTMLLRQLSQKHCIKVSVTSPKRNCGMIFFCLFRVHSGRHR